MTKKEEMIILDEILKSKDKIIEKAKPIPIEKSKNLIYILLDDNEVAYVGQTTQGIIRVLMHLNSDKKFDSYFILPVEDESDLNYYESTLIMHYKPKYNKTLFINKMFIQVSRLRRYLVDNNIMPYETITVRLKRLLSESTIPIHNFKLKPYVTYKDIPAIVEAYNNMFPSSKPSYGFTKR